MHYYQFIADLKRRFETDRGKRFDGSGDRSWTHWFRQPYSPLMFELVEKSAASGFGAIELKMLVQDKLMRFGRLKLWAYGFSVFEEQDLMTAFRQASVLCARAGHALLAQPQKPEVRRILEAYFGGADNVDGFLISKIADQYVGVMAHLNAKYVVLAKGDTRRSGRAALAYVDPREDQQALMSSGLKDVFGDKVVIVYINDLEATAAGTLTPVAQADHSVKDGATLLHELTHVCGSNKSEDHPLSKIDVKTRRSLGIPDRLGECYGRTACKALGSSGLNALLNVTNADTLALLAVDLYLVQARRLAVNDVLALR